MLIFASEIKNNIKFNDIMAKYYRNRMKMVMDAAWRMVKTNGMTMSEALHIAWENIKLNTLLKSRENVKFIYKKKGGEERVANGTLLGSMIPNFVEDSHYVRKTKEGNMAYYDTDKKSWRSFICANLVKICED